MYKLAALLFLTTGLAKIINPKYDYIQFEHSNSLVQLKIASKPGPVGSAWVLRLEGDVDALKLRAATPTEVEEVFPASKFNDSPSPRQGRRLKKDDPNKSPITDAAPKIKPKDADEKAMVSEIMRAINKFASTTDVLQYSTTDDDLISSLTTNTEPDAYLPEDGQNSPSLQLYFKDTHTSLVVKAEGRRWQYVIGPPALFPEWFYEEHTSDGRDSQGAFVEIPKSVKMEFYSTLFHMLTMFLSFPV
ncbi:hypothetical protein MSG28_013562 [Choristoneura fumiferana]|uniref:Uncharacterized protein n=1 Tax=Choristoneura fumiferana TaxID=7141 RepID=A0ACC0K7Y2_CHOFU|nr:hypothetical protein MSG28_013562 [Choristoneura fumiferana]